MRPAEDVRGRPVAWSCSDTGLYHVYCVDWREGGFLRSACGKARVGFDNGFAQSVPEREVCGACRLWVLQTKELHERLEKQEAEESRRLEQQAEERRRRFYCERSKKAALTKRKKQKKLEELRITREQLRELEKKEDEENRRATARWREELKQTKYFRGGSASEDSVGDTYYDRVDLQEHGFSAQCIICGCHLYSDTEINVCDACADERYRDLGCCSDVEEDEEYNE